MIHPVSGGIAALSAAVLLAFATDLTTRPSAWAIPVAAVVLTSACVIWLLTRPSDEGGRMGTRVHQGGAGAQTAAAHSGQGDIFQSYEHNYYRPVEEDSEQARRAAALRAADKATYEDLAELVPRHVITFLEEHDFGASWFDAQVSPLYTYRHTRNAVEHQFHDQVLEERRFAFYAIVEKFTLELSQHSSPSEHGRHFELNEKQWTRSHPPGDDTYRRYELHRRTLNELADEVVEAYNALVEEARRRVP